MSSMSTTTATSKLSAPTTNSNRSVSSKSNSNPNPNRPATASNAGLSVHMWTASASPLDRPSTSVGLPSASVGARPSIITRSSLNHADADGRSGAREPYPAWRVWMVRKARKVGMGGLGGLSGA
ncbi:hypothetical protein JAAARDRAFT_660999 [Jaapia argillacea MUCL 33604]|uniref:Uncharacterized protein n=1 Tax=Jaapia argillacea MUCL 33604 TaxID=933084 RepID=A0A067P646_9AGAM|nr:hypothetical protein JAAARDRAFT_660999 [Jaapia argillacea MUCL 33604]